MKLLIKIFSYFLMMTVYGFSMAQIAHPLENKNPTFYSFNFSADEVRNAIAKEFNKVPGYRYMRPELLSDGKLKSFLEEKKEVKTASENDYYLRYSDSIGKSEMYYDKDDKPLNYYAEFLIHLIPVDSKSTRVEIITINPRIVVGRKTLPSLPHFGRMEKTKQVEPSTIEEYEILLKIGTGLGVSESMPGIERPKI